MSPLSTHPPWTPGGHMQKIPKIPDSIKNISLMGDFKGSTSHQIIELISGSYSLTPKKQIKWVSYIFSSNSSFLS